MKYLKILRGHKKKGAVGEGIYMIYRIVFISFIALVIFGISSLFYAYYLDVRDAESAIMVRNVVDCLAPEGVVNLDLIKVEDRNNLLVYCGFSPSSVERFYVKVNLKYGPKEVSFFSGDSGKVWVREIFEKGNLVGSGVGKYEPGYFPLENKQVFYPVLVEDSGEKTSGELTLEVLVSDEF